MGKEKKVGPLLSKLFEQADKFVCILSPLQFPCEPITHTCTSCPSQEKKEKKEKKEKEAEPAEEEVEVKKKEKKVSSRNNALVSDA